MLHPTLPETRVKVKVNYPEDFDNSMNECYIWVDYNKYSVCLNDSYH